MEDMRKKDSVIKITTLFGLSLRAQPPLRMKASPLFTGEGRSYTDFNQFEIRWTSFGLQAKHNNELLKTNFCRLY